MLVFTKSKYWVLLQKLKFKQIKEWIWTNGG